MSEGNGTRRDKGRKERVAGPRRWIIAMDGPAGVGKSTVGHLVAKRLGYHFINTGEMYRALTWKALQEGLDLADGEALTRLAERLRWEFKPTDEGTTLKTFIDGEGVTVQIRDETVSKNSSAVAGVPGVRKHLRQLQRELGEGGAIVMEGRDITTNVFPDADFKVYLDADIEERAERRYRQLRAAGKEPQLRDILDAMIARDRQDLERKINPLRQAEDAVVIDSTRLSLHEVADQILEHVRRRRRQRRRAGKTARA
ncbi:MAG: (d)CMP kinase [Elusimicrobia bacterium]|nr:(d)CMP kinase [Elusimicrobiota bacterium]